MTDTWTIRVVDKNQRLLGAFVGHENPAELAKCLAAGAAGMVVLLDIVASTYTADGLVEEIQVFKNNWLYSIAKDITDSYVYAGDLEDRPCAIYQSHIDYVTRIRNLKPGDPDEDPPTLNRVAAEVKVCTCGVKFTGGMCSDWCDLVRIK
jgi:hypothetical protein